MFPVSNASHHYNATGGHLDTKKYGEENVQLHTVDQREPGRNGCGTFKEFEVK